MTTDHQEMHRTLGDADKGSIREPASADNWSPFFLPCTQLVLQLLTHDNFLASLHVVCVSFSERHCEQGIEYLPCGATLTGQWREGVFTGPDNTYTYPGGRTFLRGAWDEQGSMSSATAWCIVSRSTGRNKRVSHPASMQCAISRMCFRLLFGCSCTSCTIECYHC